MNPSTTQSTQRKQRIGWGLVAGVAALLAGCTSTPLPPEPPLPQVITPPPPTEATPPALPVEPAPTQVSQAKTPREYRRDAASHVYGKNADRIYRGKMPPLLYAIGVLVRLRAPEPSGLTTNTSEAPSLPTGCK